MLPRALKYERIVGHSERADRGPRSALSECPTIRSYLSARGSIMGLVPASAYSNVSLGHAQGGAMRGWHPMHLILLSALCGSAMSCRRDIRTDAEAAIRAATREWNAAEAAKDLEKCISFYADDGE